MVKKGFLCCWNWAPFTPTYAPTMGHLKNRFFLSSCYSPHRPWELLLGSLEALVQTEQVKCLLEKQMNLLVACTELTSVYLSFSYIEVLKRNSSATDISKGWWSLLLINRLFTCLIQLRMASSFQRYYYLMVPARPTGFSCRAAPRAVTPMLRQFGTFFFAAFYHVDLFLWPYGWRPCPSQPNFLLSTSLLLHFQVISKTVKQDNTVPVTSKPSTIH